MSAPRTDALIETIRSSIIGRDRIVDGPFGSRPIVYADYTASGRALSFVEEFIAERVLPLYANTHTESSGTGRQTTRFRDEAREIVRRSVGATRDEHAVLFCGSGATHAIDRLIRVLGLRVPADLDARYGLTSAIPRDERPVVFIGPFEHHSNELPWRESIAELITIREDVDGHIDVEHLEAELAAHADRPLLIGSFSAASNVTGIVSDTATVSQLIHRYGGLAFWDFAAAAPYLPIDVGTTSSGAGDHLDAVFISTHKLIGGPQTPGVLVARRELFANTVPAVPGGGTVRYVNPTEHVYLDDPEHREEGGTPAIVESIRAGLVFQLKDAVGAETIHRLETAFARRAITSWRDHPNIEILGNPDVERLSIVSFVIRHPEGYLHHNFVVALLDDLFGIQTRGGCSCAGPYGHRLLGIDIERSHRFEAEIGRGCEGIKPGWVRLNFNYFIDEDTLEYLIDSVLFVAENGHLFLDRYEFDPVTGMWQHESHIDPSNDSLLGVWDNLADGVPPAAVAAVSPPAPPLDAYIDRAQTLVAEHVGDRPTARRPGRRRGVLSDDGEALRWFPLA